VKEFLPFIVLGLATGSVYGLSGVGLVLTYRTSGVFNFAYGSVATVAAYLFFELRELRGWNPWLAMIVSILLVGVVGGLLCELMGRQLVRAGLAYTVTATVGLILVVQGGALLHYGGATREVRPFLPTHSVNIAGVGVGEDKLLVALIAVVSTVALYAFMRLTRLGTFMRAVVQNEELVSLTGTSPTAVRRWAWIIGSSFAALSGVLLVPNTGLDSAILTLLVVQAFGAAAVGAFANLPLSFLGGLGIGVASSLAIKYLGQVALLQGIPPSLPFIVLFTVLLVTPRRRLQEVGTIRRTFDWPRPILPAAIRTYAGVAAAAVLCSVPLWAGTHLPVYSNGIIYLLMFLSLYLLVRLSGQISLCHMAFAAVGAAAMGHLVHVGGLPWLLALLLAGLVTVPVGAVVAIPAIRLSPLYLAIATFGFGILLQNLAYPRSFMFGSYSSAVVIPRPHLLGLSADGDRSFYFVLLAIAAAVSVGVAAVVRGRLGRALRALSDSPAGLSALGGNVSAARIWVFCISAFIAGVAGGLFGALSGSINGTAFQPFQSLQLLVVLVIAGEQVGRGAYASAALASLATAVIPGYFTDPNLNNWLTVLFGAAAVAAGITAGLRTDQAAARQRRWPWTVRELVAPVRYGDRTKASPVRTRG
jgi:branched-subunit amino acid ABC-type transport system permease component